MIKSLFGINKSDLPKALPVLPEGYSARFALDRLRPGVDNIHFDVHLSPDFHKAAAILILQLLVKHTQTERILNLVSISEIIKNRNEFLLFYREFMLEAVGLAKARANEMQIDLLAQTATVKMLLREIQLQFDLLLAEFNRKIQELDDTNRQGYKDLVKLNEKLTDIKRKRGEITAAVSSELFGYVYETQRRNLHEAREAAFGIAAIPPEHLFANPILRAGGSSAPFMVENYVLLGNRLDDPDRYESILSLLRNLIMDIDPESSALERRSGGRPTAREQNEAGAQKDFYEQSFNKVEGLIKQVSSFDILLNFFETEERARELQKQEAGRQETARLERQADEQRVRLDYFYARFQEKGLLDIIAAAFEMKPYYLDYCPPLVPYQVMQYLVFPELRKELASKLKGLSKFYNKDFSTMALDELVVKLRNISPLTVKKYLLDYIKGFVCFHRDFVNFNMLKAAMDSINLATDEKILKLSRANNTLYEFLLSHEQVIDFSRKEIVGHVILKADVRGATEITHQLRVKALNPASYFSLNFFDPISAVVLEYGATKLFIEGDAIILSILERDDRNKELYCVARACGLAVNMLTVVMRYNSQSRKNQLPVLELGMGVYYLDSPPTFLFDGDKPIMISRAINLADRLSSCSKPLRKRFVAESRPFNLYVYQTATDEEVTASGDDLSLRYNLNGIELNDAGFRKLSREVEMQVLECHIPELQQEKFTVYTGKFPLAPGKYQRLIVREAPIPQVTPDDLSVKRMTSRKYYEVCAQARLYEYVRRHV